MNGLGIYCLCISGVILLLMIACVLDAHDFFGKDY